MYPTVTSARSSARLSHLILAFAAMLAVAAAWLLIPAVARLVATSGPTMSNACRAAGLAVIRGDLWAACAEGSDVNSGAHAPQRAVEETVSWTPTRSKAWLRLAADAGDLGRNDGRAVEALRMSFYTGPHELDVISMRLSVSLRPGMLIDTDMERLVRHDILTVLTHAPHLKPALIVAYQDASPEGRRFLAEAVEEIEPGFAPDLRSRELPRPDNKE